MTVKLVSRTLAIIEIFAQEQRPLVLSELADLLDIPVSSCLGMVRTLVEHGYVYEVRKRGGYYPTKKLWVQASRIDKGDPLLDVVHEHLAQLQQQVNESVVLGKVQDDHVVYLDVIESNQSIRYSAHAGDIRPLHANSIGKAILAQLPDEAVLARLAQLPLQSFNGHTIASPQAFVSALKQVRVQGWGANVSESAEDLAAVAMAFEFANEWYGVSIVGPLLRMQKQWAAHPGSLSQCVQHILNDLENAQA